MSEQENPLKSILVEALEIEDAQQRAAFVSRACGPDSALRRQVEELIHAHAAAGKFLPEQPAFTGVRDALLSTAQVLGSGSSACIVPVSESPGDRIGRYKLLQQIGEGGCGVVYMAEQEEPVRRRVALKVIKLGMDTKQVVARFEAERQALAMMDHPNIAKVLDAGATDTGRPYFVMDLVRGAKITQYCDENRLPMQERLELFIHVCQAIQHAHQKGVIHRDLKPSNILVTVNDGVAVPNVIDFGIAKATEGRLTDLTVFTAFDQFLGTPAYMSPEQAVITSQDIDTRSDIYSLGVLLYELLTGRTPFDTRELLASGLDEMRRTIREKEPERPSTRLRAMPEKELTTTAQRRGSEAPKLFTILGGDLDWIVMKCLEKDRTRRYGTASALAMDIQRHLCSEPVVARPPSNLYRFQKLVWRNRLVFSIATALAGVLLFGAIVNSWEAVRARHAEREAQQAQAKAEAEERIARQESYANAMLLAYESLESSDFGAVRDLLKQTGSFAGDMATNNRTRPVPAWEWRHLGYETRDEASTVWAECASSVHSLAVSGDNGWLAAGTKNGEVLLWHLPDRDSRREWHLGADVLCLAFSPKNQALAVGGRDGNVHLLAIPSGQVLAEFSLTNIVSPEFAVSNKILDLRFSPDGSRLGFCSPLGFSIANLENNSIWQAPPFTNEAWRVAISADLGMVARALVPEGLAIYQSGTNTIVWDVIGNRYHTSQGLAISPDGLWLAVPLADRSIEIWSLKELRRFRRLTGHLAAVNALAWSADSRLLASGSEDQSLAVWHVRSGKLLRQLRGHERHISTVVFSTKDLTLYSGGGDKTIRVWRSWEAEPIPDVLPLPRETANAKLAPGARFLVLQDGEGAVIQTTPIPKIYKFTPPLPGQYCEVSGVSPDGSLLAAHNGGDVCEIWRHQPNGFVLRAAYPALEKMRGRPSFSADGRRIALVAADGSFGVWQVEPWRELARWEGAEAHYSKIIFDPPGKRVLIVCDTKEAIVGDVESGRLFKIPREQSDIGDVDFSPDNRLIATSTDNSVILWAFAPGEEPRRLTTLAVQKVGAWAVAFSPDGQRIAVGMADGQIHLWDVQHRMKVGVLKGHKQPVWGLGFNPDDDSLVSISPDQLRVWRVSQDKN